MLRQVIDIVLVLSLTYAVLLLIGERRTLWMVRGFVVLMLITAISRHFELTLLSFFLTYLTLGASVAMAVLLQTEFRRFLERLGRGEIWRLLTPVGVSNPKSDDTIDELVDAVKELSQNRTGALIVLETDGAFDERDFSVPGVQLQAQVSKELIQTIFQTSTLLHDGAILIQGANITSAGAILPLSDRQASRQLGTRHRAAMGITERVENCLCVVVSEETGSISLAQQGKLNRPLTSSRLRELLQEQFSVVSDRDAGPGGWNGLSLNGLTFSLPPRSRVRRWFGRFRRSRSRKSFQFSRAIAGYDSESSDSSDYFDGQYGDRPTNRWKANSRLSAPASAPSPSGPVVDIKPLPDRADLGKPDFSESEVFDQDFVDQESLEQDSLDREVQEQRDWAFRSDVAGSDVDALDDDEGAPESNTLGFRGRDERGVRSEEENHLRPNTKPDVDKYNWGSEFDS